MYEIFYNLKSEPFRLSPDHRFCYDHKDYAKARAYMAYAFMRAEGFVMITGRPGTGKTTLIGELIEKLADEDVVTANLVCTQLDANDLLKMVAYSFGVDSSVVEKGDLLQRLGTLLQKWHRERRRALLIVDEAQDLSTSAMEELRLLTNIQVNGIPLLQIFLLGQTELRDLILSPRLEQVHQRIVAACHLEPLQEEETEEYIIHRLQTVGWLGDPELSKSIFPLLYKFSEGIPRRINLICSRLFLHGSVEQRHRIGVKDVRDVITELQSESLAAGRLLTDYDFSVDDVFADAGASNDPKCFRDAAMESSTGESKPQPELGDISATIATTPTPQEDSSGSVTNVVDADARQTSSLFKKKAEQELEIELDLAPLESGEPLQEVEFSLSSQVESQSDSPAHTIQDRGSHSLRRRALAAILLLFVAGSVVYFLASGSHASWLKRWSEAASIWLKST